MTTSPCILAVLISFLTAKLVNEAEGLEPLMRSWRELAHICARPSALPEWLLGWWSCVAPPDALLRTIAVFDSDESLVGLAPLFCVAAGGRIVYRLLGAPFVHRLFPLARPGSEGEVVHAVAETLAEAEPRPHVLVLDGIDADPPWLEALADEWPGRSRPWSYTANVVWAPEISLAGTFDEWLATRSSKFRQQMRRADRAVERAGGRIVLATNEAEIERGCDAFARLHAGRWNDQDDPSYLTPGWFAAIRTAAPRLAATGDLRLWLLELDDQVVAVELSLAAGGDVEFFNGGWDRSAAKFSPALLIRFAAIRDAFARGERRLDMGGGRHEYKLRFATAESPLRFGGLVPRNLRYPLTRVQLLTEQSAHKLIGRIPDKRRAQLKRLIRNSGPE
jgi:CelD/BcsL family acetyltransferase involved in cellulose biosynthesis